MNLSLDSLALSLVLSLTEIREYFWQSFVKFLIGTKLIGVVMQMLTFHFIFMLNGIERVGFLKWF